MLLSNQEYQTCRKTVIISIAYSFHLQNILFNSCNTYLEWLTWKSEGRWIRRLCFIVTVISPITSTDLIAWMLKKLLKATWLSYHIISIANWSFIINTCMIIESKVSWNSDIPQTHNKSFILIHSIFHTLICKMCIMNQQNALNSTDVILLWYFHVHVSASSPAFFRVTFLLQF